ncbi:hypothetical protein Btru_015866 [Bulinus truncatus]|nr:hypothetical protein Btru_015866 [Bulinus truncatus]
MDGDTLHVKDERYSDVELFNFYFNNMTIIQRVILRNSGAWLLHLNLDYNGIAEIPTGLAEALQVLEIFSLKGNRLRFLPDDIGHVHSLKVLFVNLNIISVLPESLHRLKKLQVLDAGCNKLRKLYSEIGQNASLQILKVEKNKLKYFPATLGLLHNLKILQADENNIEFLPSTFQLLTNLNKVNLSCNNLKNVQTLSTLRNLTDLDLSRNKLVKLFETFSSFHTLENVCLDFNMLTEIPLWVGNLINLQVISVRNNKLGSEFLPDDFHFKSKKLTKIDLSGNVISKFPTSFCKLESLQILSIGSSTDDALFGLCRNWLQALPDNFVNLKLLTVLHLEDNQLRALPEDFGKLKNLEEAYLGSNMIDKIPESFSHLVSLRICQLSDNGLKVLPDHFGALKNLVELYLDFNQLKKLPDSMRNLINLEILNLKGNELNGNTLPIIVGMSSLKKLFFDSVENEKNKIGCIANNKEDSLCLEANVEKIDEIDRMDYLSLEGKTDIVPSGLLAKTSEHDLDMAEESWDVDLEKDKTQNNDQFDLDEADSSQQNFHQYLYASSLTWNIAPTASYARYYSRLRSEAIGGSVVVGQFDDISY